MASTDWMEKATESWDEKRIYVPTLKDLSNAIKHVKSKISDEYRAFEEDEIPGIQLTVGCNGEKGEWACQTGDNSFFGNAYGYPAWAVVGVYRKSNSMDLARELQNQLLDQF
ncbi:hypothetical protein UFOVP142_8 [uncultured Caudovirales phage]|uniref:Uncharacterized protein n=1 Tax=uncultured Caudovirales phage TaxID=2100421 RepID=A0A6J7XQA2_9CAUD|nr:hypothetical protein UFOVP142_8 [uncultured Caudovirales phage]